MIDIENAVFSDDKTTFAIRTEQGVYINTTGRPLRESEIKPKSMRCIKCGTIYENATLLTVPHPCPCGSRGFTSHMNEREK